MMYLNHNEKLSSQLEFLLQLQISITIMNIHHNIDFSTFDEFSSKIFI